LEYWNVGIMGSGLRLGEENVAGFIGKFYLTWKLIMLIEKILPFKINIPIFHHSIIPFAGSSF
jgi:hypothetical protein